MWGKLRKFTQNHGMAAPFDWKEYARPRLLVSIGKNQDHSPFEVAGKAAEHTPIDIAEVAHQWLGKPFESILVFSGHLPPDVDRLSLPQQEAN
jgi:hypothetical protein